MEPTVQKLENLLEDPRSGGYSGKAAEEGSRWILAEKSLKLFSEHPFLGGGSGGIPNFELVGGHSSFFDMLGFYGLLGGGGAFVCLLLVMLGRAFRRLLWQRTWGAAVVAVSVLLLVVAGVVNPYWSGITTVFLVTRLFRMEGERT
jgi:hypothetical protein